MSLCCVQERGEKRWEGVYLQLRIHWHYLKPVLQLYVIVLYPACISVLVYHKSLNKSRDVYMYFLTNVLRKCLFKTGVKSRLAFILGHHIYKTIWTLTSVRS